MTDQNQPKKTINVLKIVIWIALAIVGVVIAVITYNLVSKIVASWSLTSLPGAAIIEPTPVPLDEQSGETEPAEAAPATDLSTSPSGPQAELWDGASRVNVLIIGLDLNDWRGDVGAPLSDTMILLTLDPLTESAGMLSIPRDLWVSIPGFDNGKINTAYQLGEAYKLPNGGPGLALQTVEKLLGVPIQYYAQIDFEAFVYFVDQLEGVKIDVPNDIMVDIYDDAYGKIMIRPGIQTLSGEYALAYARARNSRGGDFDRSARQQQVIMGIRQRILEFDVLPSLIQNSPEIYQHISNSINTNLTLDQVVKLASLALGIDTQDIKSGIISPPNQVTLGRSPDGLEILKPIPDQIRILRDEIFASANAAGPLDYEGKEAFDLFIEEGASIKILNGTSVSGLGTKTGEYLQSLGANVAIVGDADGNSYSSSSIYDYSGNPYALQYLAELFGMNQFNIHGRYDNASDVDVTIILGATWANNNPMP
ncbi:MAG: LCP family protein [Anaerolineales bacterium]|nr:LCP family protein [Chloroflexota bacterium]MBL6981498.1 LCP family protein [Anaerolineales bacterium]